jgi:hypothetical protein
MLKLSKEAAATQARIKEQMAFAEERSGFKFGETVLEFGKPRVITNILYYDGWQLELDGQTVFRETYNVEKIS